MEADSQYIKHGWVWLISILIFFFNTFLLPEGLTLVLLLTPVWIYLLYLQKKPAFAIPAILLLIIFFIPHVLNGVELSHYLVSLLIIIALIIFLAAAYQIILNPVVNWDLIFRDIAILNFTLAIVSIALLYIPMFKPIVWYLVPISPNVPPVPRLKLFASEASHYSFWLAPIAIYFYSRILFFRARRPLLTLLIVTLPLLLSFSMGVLSTLLITGGIILFVYFDRIFSSAAKRRSVYVLLLLSVITLVIAYFKFPGNPLFARIHNIMNGEDTSARGRTYEAFILAHKIAAQKSLLWGIGPGQLKLIGREVIINFYSYSHMLGAVRIPNASAETIAYFGYIGFAIRILLEIILFFYTRLYKNPYRLWLFLFVFIYQFTGSYITNAGEYLVWLLAFAPIFPDFIDSQQPTIITTT